MTPFAQEFYRRDTIPIKYRGGATAGTAFTDWLSVRRKQIIEMTREILPEETASLSNTQVHCLWVAKVDEGRGMEPA